MKTARKSQTTKDLSKPWASFHELHRHSAYTTLLLDDSPAKVRLQPYNHLCVPEYNAEIRNRDLSVLDEWLSRRGEKESSLPEGVTDMDQNVDASTPVNDALRSVDPPSDSSIASDKSSVPSAEQENLIDEPSRDSSTDTPISHSEINSKTRVEKRKEKKERKKQEKALRGIEDQTVKFPKAAGASKVAGLGDSPRTTDIDGKSTPLAVTGEEDQSHFDGEEGMRLDETLLAAIGILDEMKSQHNVAAWIKSGGLWAGNVPPVSIDTNIADSLSHNEVKERAPSPTDEEVEDLGLVATAESSATSPAPQPTSPPTSPIALKSSSSRPASPEHSSQERKRFRSLTTDTPTHDGESDSKKSKHGLSEDNAVIAGNDAETVGDRPSDWPTSSDHSEVKESVVENGVGQGSEDTTKTIVPKMWFENDVTFRAWVTRGRAALKSLGIEERHGIEII